MRLIDADEIIKNLTAMQTVYDAIALDGMIKALQEAPTIEAAPVVHGEWVEIEKRGWSSRGINGNPRFICSECHKDAVNYYEEERGHGSNERIYKWVKTDFCPNCGAKMRTK